MEAIASCKQKKSTNNTGFKNVSNKSWVRINDMLSKQ